MKAADVVLDEKPEELLSQYDSSSGDHQWLNVKVKYIESDR